MIEAPCPQILIIWMTNKISDLLDSVALERKIEGRKALPRGKGLTQQAVWEAAGVSKSSYTSYEAGRGMPAADKVVSLAHVLGTTTDELLLDPSEMSVSQDMGPILKRFEPLPPDMRHQAKIALKGVLFGYEQEALR